MLQWNETFGPSGEQVTFTYEAIQILKGQRVDYGTRNPKRASQDFPSLSVRL